MMLAPKSNFADGTPDANGIINNVNCKRDKPGQPCIRLNCYDNDSELNNAFSTLKSKNEECKSERETLAELQATAGANPAMIRNPIGSKLAAAGQPQQVAGIAAKSSAIPLPPALLL